jgi:replicative DNA helicase
MTEQDPAEIQTMILAYLTGYNEDMFLYGTYNEEHMDRIMKAINIMETYKDNMLFARIPDPCASVIKNLFRRYNLQYGVENFFYDYIFSSPAMLAEYRDLKLREDVCLRLLTTTLKNLAIELNSFVSTSTQISNDDDPKGGFRDYRNIRGSKSIADLADFGCIMSRPTTDELKMIEGFHKQFTFSPNLVTDVYKNRRGRWTTVRIWSLVDLGTCRKYDLFVTTADMKPIEDFQIVEFIFKKTEEMKRLEDFYNDGVVDDAMAESLLNMIDEVTPASVSDSIEEAFGNAKERKERLKNMDWGDYI